MLRCLEKYHNIPWKVNVLSGKRGKFLWTRPTNVVILYYHPKTLSSNVDFLWFSVLETPTLSEENEAIQPDHLNAQQGIPDIMHYIASSVGWGSKRCFTRVLTDYLGGKIKKLQLAFKYQATSYLRWGILTPPKDWDKRTIPPHPYLRSGVTTSHLPTPTCPIWDHMLLTLREL